MAAILRSERIFKPEVQTKVEHNESIASQILNILSFWSTF